MKSGVRQGSVTGRRSGARHLPSVASRVLETSDASLLDLVDNVLNKGVIINGDVILSIADVDLVYLRLSVLLCAADRVFPSEAPRKSRRRRAVPIRRVRRR